MTYSSQLCSFFLIKLRPRAHFFWYSSDISTLTQTRSYFCALTWTHWQKESQNAFGYREMPQAYHTGHIRMRTFDLTDTEYGEEKGQQRGSSAKIKSLFVGSYMHVFILQLQRTNKEILKPKESQSPINLPFESHLSLVDATLISSYATYLLFPHTSCVFLAKFD